MENIKNNKTLIYRSGKSFSEVHTAYLQALQEAKSLGIEEDEVKVMSILETILEIDEESYKETSKKITNRYLESGKDFNSFMEELVSGDIPQDVRPMPDMHKDVKEEEDENDDLYNHQLDSNVDNIENVINDKDVDHL